MRTLKKTLSLLLAVALVLSLTVVGASAAYTGNKVDTLKDAADVGADYSEAVGVMVGLGIIEGYDDGTLRPETNYTREQAAKIIAYMQLGPEKADSLRCTTAPFTDVAADRWSAGYIAYGVEQGIIDGMGDGTFQPEAQRREGDSEVLDVCREDQFLFDRAVSEERDIIGDGAALELVEPERTFLVGYYADRIVDYERGQRHGFSRFGIHHLSRNGVEGRIAFLGVGFVYGKEKR